MNLDQLRHVVLEIGERFGIDMVYVVGSSAILATIADPQEPALVSTRDVDIALPPGTSVPVERIDFVIGEGSEFDMRHGYYAQGVDLTTPRFAPSGWMQRAIEIRVRGISAHCMEVHDLALAKYGAGREKDLQFTRALARLGLVDRAVLESRLPGVATTNEHRTLIAARIARDFGPLA